MVGAASIAEGVSMNDKNNDLSTEVRPRIGSVLETSLYMAKLDAGLHHPGDDL